VTRLTGKLDVLDFGAIAQEVREIEQRALHAGARDLVVGTHCRYCPAIQNCPAQTTMVKAIAADTNMALTASDFAATLTPVPAAKAWGVIKAAKAAIELIEESVRLFAASTPIDLPGGKALGMVERESERVDGGVAWAVLGKRLGKEAADAAVSMDTSKKAIKDAIRSYVANHVEPKPKMAVLERAVLDDIRAMNGSRTTTSRSVREHAKKEAT
jgi:hypothetical protein